LHAHTADTSLIRNSQGCIPMAPSIVDSMAPSIADQRARACRDLLRQAHAITDKEGITPSALHAIKQKLVALAAKAHLFPPDDFAPPVAQGRNHRCWSMTTTATACT
jgi:hypothetical protein